ncbi:DNA-binding response regulator [Thiorhodovibrio winogradskyi]|nr:DNA-binding response regulator [Thiorhodovibrio winogradskyi]
MTQANEQWVFVVDDDADVRDSIAELLDSVGLRAECHASARAFLDAFDTERSGCLVLDVRMAGMSGLELQQRLIDKGVGIPVILLTGHGDVPMAVEAMKAGALDFLQKPYRDQALLDAINRALNLDAAARCTNADWDRVTQCTETLTEREKDVLERVRAGKTSKDIANELDISPRTAEVHRRNLLRKFKVSSTPELLGLYSATGERE